MTVRLEMSQQSSLLLGLVLTLPPACSVAHLYNSCVFLFCAALKRFPGLADLTHSVIFIAAVFVCQIKR